MIESAYPKRAAYFAHRYCRLLTKTCAAQDLGHIGFTLCVTIAHQEDAKRYKGAVTFFNEQLMPVIGVLKWRTLDKARRRAAEEGWLYYEPGNRGDHRPGRYWVTIPEGLEDLDDAPCDETQYASKGDRPESQYAPKGHNRGHSRGHSRGEPSTLTLSANPTCNTSTDVDDAHQNGDSTDTHVERPDTHLDNQPEPTSPPVDAEGSHRGGYSEAFCKWWIVYPRKVGKKAAFRKYEQAVKDIRQTHDLELAAARQKLLEITRAFSTSPKARGEYCPHPTTWLGQGRYDDDPAEWDTDTQQSDDTLRTFS